MFKKNLRGENKMNEKKDMENREKGLMPSTLPVKKQQGRYSIEKSKRVTANLNVSKTGPRQPRGKKQRRQFKLAPNRG
jgi:hypothetical protein